jgi:hypothetical protein
MFSIADVQWVMPYLSVGKISPDSVEKDSAFSYQASSLLCVQKTLADA